MPAKFKALPKAKVAVAKRAALAKAKEAVRQFTGELSSPILVPGTDGKYPLSTTTLEPEIAKQRRAKIDLLFEHYGIQSDDKDRWRKLSACLAVDFVPGMIIVEQQYQGGSHKDKIWHFYRYVALVRDVDAIRATHGKPKIFAAICDLVEQQPEKWGAYKGEEPSLETRYYEGKRECAAAADRRAIGLWYPSKF
jgi:hypothetical protein